MTWVESKLKRNDTPTAPRRKSIGTPKDQAEARKVLVKSATNTWRKSDSRPPSRVAPKSSADETTITDFVKKSAVQDTKQLVTGAMLQVRTEFGVVILCSLSRISVR